MADLHFLRRRRVMVVSKKVLPLYTKQVLTHSLRHSIQ